MRERERMRPDEDEEWGTLGEARDREERVSSLRFGVIAN